MSALDHTSVFIMAGGSGERFWPLSRKKTPKHLLKLFGDQTLLEMTVRRLEGIIPWDRVFVLTNAEQVEATRAALPFLPVTQIIGEPAKRDTAPAVALANALARRQNPDGVLVLLPADQLIKDTATFRRNLSDLIETAATGESLCVFGIPPAHPATGFGYIEMGAPRGQAAGGTRLFQVGRFVEKPDAATAAEYVRSGRFDWNAGMFVWKVSAFMAEARRQAPALAQFVEDFPAGDFGPYLEERFVTLPKISIDYALMEKALSVIAARAEYDWDDVGAWTSLPAHLPADPSGNTLRGAAALHDSSGNIVFSEGQTSVALLGVRDLVVVVTADAVLVCPRDRVQEIKKLVPQLPPDLL
ncbi:MAG: sugar phosphate nucleotidyltransferase [Verrucomicrobiae bacterium]|nr:sugar phosphate nucleotidyltransferase [Verrucomicrobiae bacterium]